MGTCVGCPDSCISLIDMPYLITFYTFIKIPCPRVPFLCPVPGRMVGTVGQVGHPGTAHEKQDYRFTHHSCVFQFHHRQIGVSKTEIRQVSHIVSPVPRCPMCPFPSLGSCRPIGEKGGTPGHPVLFMTCSTFRPWSWICRASRQSHGRTSLANEATGHHSSSCSALLP